MSPRQRVSYCKSGGEDWLGGRDSHPIFTSEPQAAWEAGILALAHCRRQSLNTTLCLSCFRTQSFNS